MKNIKHLITFLVVSLLVLAISNVNAQVFESRVVENDMGYLVYQMRETSGTNTPTTSTTIIDITFVIRYPAGAVDIDLLCTSNPYNLVDGLAVEQTSGDGVYDYHYWNAMNTPFNSPTNWVVNQWEDIAVFKAFGATGSGLFEVAPDGWEGRSHNWRQDPPVGGQDFTPSVNGSVTYSYPTLIYDYVWTGNGTNTGFQDPHSWAQGANWEDECGTPRSAAPVAASNCYIPSGRTNYPENVNFAFVAGTGPANNVTIQSGGLINFGIPTNTGELLDFSGDLKVYGNFNIRPNGAVTVAGSTHLEGDTSLVVLADTTGIGSFKDNGTITYGTNGTAKVQIFLGHGTPPTGSFFFHQVGPTVDNATSFSGVYLDDFNLNDGAGGGTDYAYIFDEPSGSWVNIYAYATEIHTGSGMMISTSNVETHTIDSLVGQLLTGSVSSPALTTGGASYEMISNPYPSAIDFDLFFANTGNATVINNKNWIWDATIGNYLARAGGTGGVQNIQVGQAFFVETIAGGTVSFENSNRVHSTDPFRDEIINILTLDINDNETTFADQLVIRFDEAGTNGYDEAIEAIKWGSMYENSTEISSVAEDGTTLSVNVLPQLDLQGEMVSVPVNFSCGHEGEYVFTASDLESFEPGTEIWIEDKLDNYQWHHFSPGHDTYTFTASPDDAPDRFIVHFFGPTSVNDLESHNVKIYAINEYAHVTNLTKNENIEEVFIYSMSGTMVMHKQVPAQNRYRFFVSNHDGYYIVRVVTDKNIYTEKVFVH